jgi:Zn-dependent alcohol dehydrogenase
MAQRGAILEDGKVSIVDDIDVDGPREGEALVQLAAAGVCGSDLALLQGKFPFPTPALLGHEAAGRVLELGPGTEGPAPGTRVTLWMRPPCRRCRACGRGLAALCEESGFMSARGTLLDGRTSFSRGGEPLYRGFGIGAFTSTVVMPVNGLIEVPDSVPDDVAALVGCGVATGVGSVINVADPRPGDVVLVFGGGGVGLSAALAAEAVGATAVVVDPGEHRRDLARRLGVSHALESGDRDAIRAGLKEAVGLANVDVVIDTAGRPELITMGHGLVHQGGTVVAVGLQPPDAEIVLKAPVVPISHKRILGCFMGGIDPHRDLPKLFELYLAGRLPIDQLITHRRPLGETAAALDDLAEGTGLRTIIDLTGEGA